MKLTLVGLNKAKKKYDNELEEVEKQLTGLVDFNFFISHHESDGFVLVHRSGADNARLCDCMSLINKKGKLNEKDYFSICI